MRHYCREDPIDEAHAPIDDIKAVGIGGYFLGRKSTRRFARTEVWRPEVFQRGTFEELCDKPLLDLAVARAREVVAGYEPAPLADDADRHIDAVSASFAAGLRA